MRTDFTELKLPPEFAQLFPADQDALFASIRPQISDKVLESISSESCGAGLVPPFKELLRIRDGIDLDNPITLDVSEALCYGQWSNNASTPIRAFCSCALLRCPDVIEARSIFAEQALAVLLESCQQLGEPGLKWLLAYLSWSLQTMEPWDRDYLFHAHGWLIAYSSLAKADESAIESYGRWLIEAQSQILLWHDLPPASTCGQRSATFLDLGFEHSRGMWRRMLGQVIPSTDPDGALRAYLGSIR